MGWQKQRYQLRESLADQNAEELVARRVLRGLGISPKHVLEAEKEMFGQSTRFEPDKPLWFRAADLLKACMRKRGEYALPERLFEVLLTGDQPNFAVVDRLSVLDDMDVRSLTDSDLSVIFVRVRNSPTALVYIPLAPEHVAQSMEPPFNVVGAVIRAGYWLVAQSAQAFAKNYRIAEPEEGEDSDADG